MTDQEILDHAEFLKKYAHMVARIAVARRVNMPEVISTVMGEFAFDCFSHCRKHMEEERGVKRPDARYAEGAM